VNEVESGNKNSVIFTYEVSNPEHYGVVSLDANGSVISMNEKPKNSSSNLAITGLYLFNNKAVEYTLSLKPSERGELEITDLLKKYLIDSEISIVKLSLGTAWLDTGNFTAMHYASTFVKIIQDRQDIKIGDPEGAAKINNWI
jgi:glucose-1-phosphate thymidylyltransferase